jgi:hypothetical protein
MSTPPSSFRDYLLARAAAIRTRRWIRRDVVDDVLADFAQDCAENPDRVPADDAELYSYLHRRVGHLDLPQQVTGRVTVEWEKLDSGEWMRMEHTVFAGSALDWLWHQYLRVRS